MSFLCDTDRWELLNKAHEIRNREQEKIVRSQRRVKSYYQCLSSTCTAEEWKALGEGLRRMEDGELCKMEAPERETSLRELAAGRMPSEAVFMSFFHIVCERLRKHGGTPPRPSELFSMENSFFGHQCVTTCTHSIALLAYTLGLLDEKGVKNFDIERSKRIADLKQPVTSVEITCKTTELFEKNLDADRIDDLTKFEETFSRDEKLRNDQSRRRNLRDCMTDIFRAHNWDIQNPFPCMAAHGCGHMFDVLQKCVLDESGAELPKRNWILSLCLYMHFSEEEANRLMYCCGYVGLHFEPWEVGVSYLLRQQFKETREALCRREEMFAFLCANGLEPPPSLFAAFPYLAACEDDEPRKLCAALFLDTCAEVHSSPRTGFITDFDSPEAGASVNEENIPDFYLIFSPDEQHPTLFSYLQASLCENDEKNPLFRYLQASIREDSEKNLLPLQRTSDEYKQAAAFVKEWAKHWKLSRTQPENSPILDRFPEYAAAGFRRKLLYSLMLYVLYTGHLPLKGGRFYAPFPFQSQRHTEDVLVFENRNETEACQKMAANLLRTLSFE